MYTTIKVKRQTKDFLDIVKKHDRQSYDDLIMTLAEDRLEEHLELRPELKRRIVKAAEDIKAGRGRTLKFEELYEKVYGRPKR